MAGSLKEVSSVEDLQAIFSNHDKTVLVFVAPWSRDSHKVAQELGRAAPQLHQTYPTMALATLNVSDQEDLAFDLGVSLLPYVAFYRGEQLVDGSTIAQAGDALSRIMGFGQASDEELKKAKPSPPPVPTVVDKKPSGLAFPILSRLSSADPLKIFVAGDRSKVGKSSVCLGMLGSLLKAGLRPEDIAYIKPATQCEGPQLVTKYCDVHGVAQRGIGPVVFYKGFTREFLKGSMGSSKDLLRDIKASVDEISKGKKFVLIDGVGYPAVGSICGISNADIAEFLDLPIVVVGRPGVGDAVDSFNLNACFFTSRNLRVLGPIFNRLPLEGFYSLEACKEAVTDYFRQYRPDMYTYGFLPELPSLIAVREQIEAEAKAGEGKVPVVDEEEARMQLAETFIKTFSEYVNLERLLVDLYGYFYNGQGRRSGSTTTTASLGQPLTSQAGSPTVDAPLLNGPSKQQPAPYDVGVMGNGSATVLPLRRKTRQEVEQEAKKQGAKSGG